MSSKGVLVHDLKKLKIPPSSELKSRKKKVLVNSSISSVRKKSSFYKLKKNQSLSQINYRCVYTGRSRGLIRSAKMTRMYFKEMANKGCINGLRKSSW